MKKAIIIFFIFIYIIFVVVSLVFYTPEDLFSLFALIVSPAIALFIIYWTNVKAGEGLIGLFRRKRKD